MHSRDFYHRDLKIENLALRSGGVKLVDLGHSAAVGTGATGNQSGYPSYSGNPNPRPEDRRPQRPIHNSLSKKVSTRAPEVVLGKTWKRTPETMEKVRCLRPTLSKIGHLLQS